VVGSDDLEERRAKIRQRELLLTLEQWAPAYRDVAGDMLRYVFGIAAATEAEQEWLREQVAKNGMPKTARTAEELRTLGGQANAAASAAFLAGQYDQARDLIDDARAYGALLDGEWARLHQFIDAQSAGNDPTP
jgi:high-affinity Fe2+/Pb2+ permease